MKNYFIKSIKHISIILIIALIIFSAFECSAQVKESSQDSDTKLNDNNSVDQDANSTIYDKFRTESESKIDFYENIISSLKSQNKFKDEIILIEIKISDLSSLLLGYSSENKHWADFKERVEEDIAFIEKSITDLTGNNK